MVRKGVIMDKEPQGGPKHTYAHSLLQCEEQKQQSAFIPWDYGSEPSVRQEEVAVWLPKALEGGTTAPGSL